MTSGFYITLPSNTKGKISNSENTLSSYTTYLAKPLNLRNDWEIGLVEVIYPLSFYNVRNATDCGIDFVEVKPGKLYSFENSHKTIPPGYYSKPAELMKLLNDALFVKANLEGEEDRFLGLFEYSFESGHVQFTSNSPHTGDLVFSEGLKDLLGFSKTNITLPPYQAVRTDKPLRLNLFVPDQLFIYSDLVSNVFVGDSLAPLLRAVVVDSEKSFGTTISKSFESPHYVKLAKNYFNSIDINIRNSLGDLAPFQFGTVTCKVHLRPAP